MLRLLAVDDDPISRALYEAIARGRDWEIYAVATCEEAVAFCATVRFDIVLMDWNLGGKTGLECTKMLRAQQEESGIYVPIVAITAHAMEKHRQACIEAGMDDYVSKPFRATELIDKIEYWSNHAREKVNGTW